MVQSHKSDPCHQIYAKGIGDTLIQRQSCREEAYEKEHQQVGQTSGQGIADHIPEETTLHPAVVWLHCQEKARYADGQRADER